MGPAKEGSADEESAIPNRVPGSAMDRSSRVTSRRCTATCADGSPCRAWAVHGTHPPLCSAHRPDADWGAPAGNQNALKHGYYATCPDQRGGNLPDDCTIDTIIDMLYDKQVALDRYIDRILTTGRPSTQELIHLLRIHGQNASRLGRLLRDRRALSGDAADGISGAIAQALEELHNELGTDLT